MALRKYPGLMYGRVWFTGLLMLLLHGAVTAQDPQFSQFYAAPLYLNPAFTGSTNQTRVGLNYRNQWPSIDGNFTTMSANADHYMEDINSAVGIIINRDVEGLAGRQSTSVGLLYSYALFITEKLGFRPGAQVAVYNRSVNFDKLTFASQYNAGSGQFTNPSGETFNSDFNKTFVDLSLGGLFFTKVAYHGFAAYHLNQPNQSVIDEHSKLPMKFSVHGGFKYFMKPGHVGSGVYAREAERSVGPAIQHRHQGQFDQLDVGMYYTAEPLVLGIWYRGVPCKNVNDYVNNESIVLLLGFTQIGPKHALSIGYSFDYTISKLTANSGGAHEFSLSYTWSTRNPRKPPKSKMVIPCPDF